MGAVACRHVSMALTSTQFVITEAALAAIVGIFEDDWRCWRRRTAIGSIRRVPLADTGEPTVLAGGGGSVRGYEFQSIGPLDRRNDPIGGRSLVEVNAEARVKVIGPFGVVPFIDGGQVYEETYPQPQAVICRPADWGCDT